jgi:predicted LPLAT superfamily acyltransferase/uncharacterized protein (DUF2062 family)
MPPEERPRLIVVVPVYNHAATVGQVVREVLLELPRLAARFPDAYVHPRCIVMDDGSRDAPNKALEDLDVIYLRHPSNKGKGAAILTTAVTARDLGMTHLLTLDADGQHAPADMASFVQALLAEPHAVHVGERDFDGADVPKASRFGRSFSNFWLRVHTGIRLADSQSGFRLYPLAVLLHLRLWERRYAFEIEVLVKAAWAGFPLRDVPIHVHYPEKGRRVSHFRKLRDNVDISLLNTRLTMRSLLPWPHKRLDPADDTGERFRVVRPLASINRLLGQGVPPRELGLSSGLGVLIGALPIFGLHTVAVLMAAALLGRNKLVALGANQLCMPPVVPALCIEAGYFLRHGRFLTEISLETLGYQAPQRLLEWLLGSLVLGPILAVLVGGSFYLLGHYFRWQGRLLRQGTQVVTQVGARLRPHAPPPNPDTEHQESRWTSRSIGGRLQHQFFYLLIRLGGRPLAYGFLRVVALWYVLFRPSVRRRTYHYITRRFPEARGLELPRHGFRQSVSFGESLIDRAALGILGPDSCRAEFSHGRERLAALLRGEKGVILLGAHVGCWQAAMASVDFLQRPVNMLLRRDTADLDRHWYEHRGAESPFRIIDPSEYLGGALEMLAALKRGEVLCLMGDREQESGGGERNQGRAPFLGQEAVFPVSPYVLAAASGAPIAVLFSHKAPDGSHQLECPTIMHVPPRGGLADAGRGPDIWHPWLLEYAGRLEAYCREHPYQFYNFHDMWRPAATPQERHQ